MTEPVEAPEPVVVPASGKRIVAVAAALVLVVLAALAAVRALRTDERTIALPASVLGLDRSDSITEVVRRQLLTPEAESLGLQAVVFGEPPNAILVTVAPRSGSDLRAALDDSARGVQASARKLGQSSDVDAGRLGGKARCWKAALQGVPAILCGFADEDSILSTWDFAATSFEQAAERGRTVREATIR